MKTRNISIDVLKIILAFLVVGLHYNFLSDVNDLLAYVYKNGIARIVVPTFLIISGFYFYNVKSKEGFKTWCLRLFLLYVIWTVIYAPFWFPIGLSVNETVKNVLYNFIVGYHHLWYLMGALISFLFLWFIKDVKYAIQLTLIIMLGTIGVFLQYNKYYHLITFDFSILNDPPIFVYRSPFLFCLPFVYIGYLINKKELYKLEFNKVFFVFLCILLVICEALFNFYNSTRSKFDMLVSLYFVCPILFITVYNIKKIGRSKTVALYSTGIYLSHILVYEILNKLNFTLFFSESIIVLITIILSIALTYFIILLKEKLHLKYLL